MNFVDNYYRTSLFVAARSAKADVVRLLLEDKRTNVNATIRPSGCTLLYNAAWNWALRSNKSCVKILLESSNVDMNVATSDGETPLHVAVKLKCTELVETLLEAPNLDVNLVDNHGWSPLLAAVDATDTDLARMLLGVSAVDVNLADSTGPQMRATPTSSACFSAFRVST